MVTKNRASTLQQQFGFLDADLKTPAHDAIMVWLDREVERLAAAYFGPPVAPTPEAVKKLKDEARLYERNHRPYRPIKAPSLPLLPQQNAPGDVVRPPYVPFSQEPEPSDWPGLGDPPELPTEWMKIDRTWEYPIKTVSGFVVGFVDMRVLVSYPHLAWEPENGVIHWVWKWYPAIGQLLYEVKSAITSVGETIRQIRLYQTAQQGDYFIVSPDARFASVLEGQGIHFVQVPPDVAA